MPFNVQSISIYHIVTVTFTIPIGVKWIKVNSGQTGYYRVLYDEDNWGYIVEELKVNHETFSPMVHMNISIDCFSRVKKIKI